LDVGPKSSAVYVDLVFDGVMRAALAVAWEGSYSEQAPVGVHLDARFPDARPNEDHEVRAICPQEEGG